MAGSEQTTEAVNARVALAKAKLVAIAQEAEARPPVAERAALLVRAQPWRGVGVALAVGIYLGITRGAALRAVAPLTTPLLGALASAALRRIGVAPAGPAASAAPVAPRGATTVRAVRRP